MKPGDFAAGIEIRKKTGVAVPTLPDKSLIHVIDTVGPGDGGGPIARRVQRIKLRKF